MIETEFLAISRKIMDTVRRGMDLCLEMQSGINDDLKDGRISRGDWERETEEIEKRKAFFMEQLDIFSETIENMKL